MGIGAVAAALLVLLAGWSLSTTPETPTPTPTPTPEPLAAAPVPSPGTVLPQPKPMQTPRPSADEEEPPAELTAEAVARFEEQLNEALGELSGDDCREPQPARIGGEPSVSRAYVSITLGPTGLEEARVVAVDGNEDYEDEVLDCLADEVWALEWPAAPSGQLTFEAPVMAATTVSLSPEEDEELREALGIEGEMRIGVK